MTKKEPKGLLVIWADVDEDYRTQYLKWHNCEHMTERVSIPGFHVGMRYQGIGEAPDFIMYYETEDSKIMATETYLNAQNNPSPLTSDAITHLKNVVRAIYSLLFAEGEKAPTEAHYLYLIRFNAVSGSEKEVIQWFREDHLKKISAVPGVYRVRLYEMDDEVSNITTAERKVHGGGPGQKRFLAYYEMASPDLPDSKAWEAVAFGSESGKKIFNRLEDIQRESYWLDFCLYAPKS